MTMVHNDVAPAFLDYSHRKLVLEYWPRLRGCVESLSAEQVWWRPNESSNSVGNIVMHLNGNVRQWLVSSFQRAEDRRDRPAEFRERTHLPPDALLAQLEATMTEADKVLTRLSADELIATFNVQGYQVTGLEAVYQVVEHFGMHYGQVVYITKQLRNEDLGFYSELDKTGRAEGKQEL